MPQKSPTSKPYILTKLGKSVERLAVRAITVGFFQACVEARGPHELNHLPPRPHPAATLLKQMRVHGVPIKTVRVMTTQELTRAIKYGAHSSAKKETTFVRTKLEEKAQEGPATAFQAYSNLLETVTSFKYHRRLITATNND